MLTHLRIKNFKAWEDTGDIRLAPLTVIFGANSAGKSSLGHLLLALKQTVQSVDRRKALHFGDSNSLIDLGTYEDCVYQHDTAKNIGFELTWKYEPPTNVSEKESLYFKADEIKITANFEFDNQSKLTKTKNMTFELCEKHTELGEFSYKENKLRVPNFNPLITTEINKFYQIHTGSITKPEEFSLVNHFAVETERVFNNIHYLGPLRDIPKRLYLWAGDAPEAVGQRGENTVAAILSKKDSTTNTYKYTATPKVMSFDELTVHSLYKLELIHEFSVEAIAKGRKEHEVFIRINNSSPKVKISNVGFGISQALPVIVQAFYAEDNSTVIMEQPEIHLHPKVQSGLADIFIDALHIEKRQNPILRNRFCKRENLQFIIESHSEHFLTRLQRRIAEEKIKPEEVAIYFVDNKAGKATIEELRINEYGDIENWPENFFGDEMGDLVARTEAAIKRRQQIQGKT